MSRPHLLPTRRGLFLAATLLLLTVTTAHAQICHDGLWPDGEFCGYDANVVTGQVDMNHDCVVNFLDIALFWPQLNMTGPNVSADINGDNVVDLSDVVLLAASVASGFPVAPCNPSPATLDSCGADLSLSFDPNIIVSRAKSV